MQLETFDIKDMILEAEAEVQEIIREVTAELAVPRMINTLHMQWMTLPDELKERLRKEQPQIYNSLMETLGHEADNTNLKSARSTMGEHGGNNATY